MGIVNVTPDSFYDGGRYHTVDAAIAHARMLQDEGADIIDIGGASSRPGAGVVAPEEEAGRVLPVIEAVAGFFRGPVSVDTAWSAVARAALDAGAQWINDISAGRFDAGMIPLVARARCKIIVMHSRGTPQTMQDDPRFDDVVADVARELGESVDLFKRGGVDREQVLIDPGIGFAKTAAHSIELIKGLDRIVALGYPVVIGTSRKSFIGRLTGREAPERLYGTLGSVAAAYLCGVSIFRVHDVAETGDFLKVLTECTAHNRAGGDGA
ncbi:MAG: dihydropteroate synthase [Chitinispirillaceae bacterium]|nr:dihydropteroate synthase [Chitinispirillaceae bacterium]